MAADVLPIARQPSKFLWLYALAWAGGAVAYVPFLTILLPIRVAALAPGEQVQWLAYMTFFGALAASVGGILFGWLSDLSRTRRPWVAMGLVATCALSLAMGLATDPRSLLLLIVAWQLALNMMLGPMAAWAADHVPRGQLGALGGLLAFSPALGSAAGAIVTIPGLVDWDGRLVLVAIMVAACVVPALALARPTDGVDAAASAAATDDDPQVPVSRRATLFMWLARFLVQISEAALFAYLYYYFRTVDRGFDAAWISRLFGIVLGISVPLALLVGRWSDRRRRPVLPLILAALLSALGLIGLAVANEPAQAVACYALFGISTTTFLSLHSAQTFRVLRRGSRRGRDLGLFNLTNTFPSLIMPVLTVAIVPAFGFPRLFLILACLGVVAAIILASVARQLRRA